MSGLQAEKDQRRERVLRELERVRRLLAEDPEVLQLVVFGSLASGQVHEGSDLDLVVVMRTPVRFLDRSLELRLHPQVGTDLVVYTPEELRELQDRPFLLEEILRAV